MIESFETNEALSLSEEELLRLATLISLILLVPLVMLVSIVQEVSSVVLEVVLSVVFEPSSLLLLQEMTVKLKRNREMRMSRCLTWFPISGLGKPKLYQNMWYFTRIGEDCGDCLTL